MYSQAIFDRTAFTNPYTVLPQQECQLKLQNSCSLKEHHPVGEVLATQLDMIGVVMGLGNEHG